MNRHRARLRSRPLAAVTAGASVFLLAACGTNDKASSGTEAGGGDGITVDTALLAFNPRTANVKAGQTVTWVGGDNIKHVLVQGAYEVGGDGLRTKETDDKAFRLDLTRKGQHVSHTYATAGTYPYFCTIHRGMNGTVVVS